MMGIGCENGACWAIAFEEGSDHSGTGAKRLLYKGSVWRGVSLAPAPSSSGPEVLPAEPLPPPAVQRV